MELKPIRYELLTEQVSPQAFVAKFPQPIACGPETEIRALVLGPERMTLEVLRPLEPAEPEQS